MKHHAVVGKDGWQGAIGVVELAVAMPVFGGYGGVAAEHALQLFGRIAQQLAYVVFSLGKESGGGGERQGGGSGAGHYLGASKEYLHQYRRYYSASSSRASSRKLTGRKPSLQEIMAEWGFFIQPS